MQNFKLTTHFIIFLVEELEIKKEDSLYRPRNRFCGRFGFSWDPFEEMNRMREEMDHMFQNSFGRSGRSQGMFSNNMSFDYDLKETDKGYEIKFDMKGLDQEKIDIQINEHSITVTGEYLRQDTEKSANRYFSFQSFGSFMKIIPLPIDADTSKVETEKEGNTLVIRLPKKNT